MTWREIFFTLLVWATLAVATIAAALRLLDWIQQP